MTLSHSFLVLGENAFAYSTLEALQEEQPPMTHRLAFISGPSGCGKSHLVQDFLERVRSLEGHKTTFCTTAAQFAADLAEASQAGTVAEFAERDRSAQTFVCEDVGALAGRFETQQQLLSLLDEVLANRSRVVVTSRQMPGELSGMLPRLAGRFHSGVCASIQPPARESRVKLVRLFASTRQVALPADAVDLLAERLAVSPRELLATVVQMETCARLKNARLDAGFARKYLSGEVLSPSLTLPQIARATARHFGVTMSSLRNAGRQQSVVLPRQCAMYLARRLTNEPLSAIAGYFGRRTHSSVIHACNRLKQVLEGRPAVRRDLTQLAQRLGTTVPE